MYMHAEERQRQGFWKKLNLLCGTFRKIILAVMDIMLSINHNAVLLVGLAGMENPAIRSISLVDGGQEHLGISIRTGLGSAMPRLFRSQDV